MGMMPPNQTQMMNPQPPQQPDQGQGQMPQGGSLTDPTALYALMGDPSAMDKIQQNPDALQPNQNPLEQPQDEPPEEIITYEDAIDSLLKLIVDTTKANLNKELQAKALLSLAQATKALQEASNPPESVRVNMNGQFDQQQMQMEMEKHQQSLDHQQQLHDQTLKHNDLNQALKEWQAQQQQTKQQQDMGHAEDQHQADMQKQMQEMMQGQEMHDATLENQQTEKPMEGEE